MTVIIIVVAVVVIIIVAVKIKLKGGEVEQESKHMGDGCRMGLSWFYTDESLYEIDTNNLTVESRKRLRFPDISRIEFCEICWVITWKSEEISEDRALRELDKFKKRTEGKGIKYYDRN